MMMMMMKRLYNRMIRITRLKGRSGRITRIARRSVDKVSPRRLFRRRIYLPPLHPARGRRIHALCDVDAVDGVEEGGTDDGDDDDDGDDVGGGKGRCEGF